MSFVSWSFIAFLALMLPAYYLLSFRWQNRLLLVANYFFYGWWDWRLLILLWLSTLVDYHVGLAIGNAPPGSRRKRWLIVSVVFNLALLGAFKYFNFFTQSFSVLLSSLGIPFSLPIYAIVLPIGISFYTFQSMSYIIDVYRGNEKATDDFLTYALFVGFFPQLVAGPISRSKQLLPQFRSPRIVAAQDIMEGVALIATGYFKKIAIADAVAANVNRVFQNPGAFSSPVLLFSLYLFAIQIYCDFSGYTDIARGVAKLFGFDLRINFRQPYLSANIAEFWRRWHISLSSWLRDYLYISMGGNRKGNARTYRNLMLTMLLGGLWHGASWNFVIWGGMHGLFLSVHRIWTRRQRNRQGAMPVSHRLTRIAAAVLTFHLVCLAWLFFRAETLALAWQYLKGLFSQWDYPPVSFTVTTVAYSLLVFLVDYSCARTDRQTAVNPEWPVMARAGVYLTMILILSFVGQSYGQPFIYFRF